MSGSGSSYAGIRTGCSCRHVHPGGSLLSRALRTSLMEKPCSALLAIFVTMKPSISSTFLGSFNDPDAMIRSYSSTVMRRGVNGAKVGGGNTSGCVGVTVDMVTTLSPHRPSTAPIPPSARVRCHSQATLPGKSFKLLVIGWREIQSHAFHQPLLLYRVHRLPALHHFPSHRSDSPSLRDYPSILPSA